jgi:hypothetical protein
MTRTSLRHRGGLVSSRLMSITTLNKHFPEHLITKSTPTALPKVFDSRRQDTTSGTTVSDSILGFCYLEVMFVA